MRWIQLGFLLILCLCMGCQKKDLSPPAKPVVLVTVAPYQFLAQKIGGATIQVRSIVSMGSDAHTFEPSPRQRESMKSAQMWFRIGEPFENLLTPLFNDPSQIVDLRDGLDLISLCSCCSGCDELDRHMWMSPTLFQKQAKSIHQALCNQFPAYRDLYDANLESVLNELNALDQEIRQKLEPLKNRTLLVSHPAFGYFCRDYALEQLSVEFEGKEPRPQYLEFLFHHVESQRPEVAITLPQHNNKGTQMIAEKLELPIKMIDPYSCDYFEMMRALTKWIVQHS